MNVRFLIRNPGNKVFENSAKTEDIWLTIRGAKWPLFPSAQNILPFMLVNVIVLAWQQGLYILCHVIAVCYNQAVGLLISLNKACVVYM